MTGWNVRLLDIVHINMYVLRYAILVVEFNEETKDYALEDNYQTPAIITRSSLLETALKN